MQRVNKDIFKVLEAALPNKTGIYPTIADQNVRYPYVVYNCDGYTVDHSKDGIIGYRMEYRISVCSDKFDEADALADSLVNVLDGYRSSNIQQSYLSGGSSSFSDQAFCHSMDFIIVVDERKYV